MATTQSKKTKTQSTGKAKKATGTSAATKKATVKSGTTKKAPVRKKKPTEASITKRAYEIFQERVKKGISGSSESDWKQAEKELTGK